MSEQGRTAVAVVGTDKRTTRDFLELLRVGLREGDTVLLASRRAKVSDARSWRVVRSGKLARVDAVPDWRPVVIVVDERAVPTGAWMIALVRALGVSDVGAAAARTNVSAGDELLVGIPYRPHEGAVHRELVRERAADPTLTDAVCLAGPSLAMRHRDFRGVDGVAALRSAAPVAELARRLAGSGRRLVVAEGAYLHMGGGPGRHSVAGASGGRGCGSPLVSACMIVKDERQDLPRCLSSLDGFADEIVVYDTGSSDGTRALARSHGAVVVEGYWDADFARARNAALAHCRGQWILWIDADEQLDCGDRPAARLSLAEMPAAAEALVVLIDNLRATKASTSLTHPACRLFRRAYGHWAGRLHEQVIARIGTRQLQGLVWREARITHWGYLRTAVNERGKARRNVRSAFADLATDAKTAWETRLVNLARSYGFAGQPDEGIDFCRAALLSASSPQARRHALRALVENLLMRGTAAQALSELVSFRAVSATSSTADLREGQALLALGRPAEALVAFDRLVPGMDEDAFELGVKDVAADRARALCSLERFGEAADVLLHCLRGSGGMDVSMETLLAALERSGRSVAEVARAVPADRAVAFLGQLVHIAAEDADRVLDAWEEAAPSLSVLATASRIAGGLPVHRQLVWSTRLRTKGLADACPLVAAAGDSSRPARTRLLGAALAAHLWGDLRGRLAVAALAATLDADARATVREELASVAPSLLPVLDGIDAAVLHPGPQAATTAASDGDGQRVLLVDRQPAAIRTLAMAVSLRRAGHQVTVTWPSHPSREGTLLEGAGVALRHWKAPTALDSEGWRRATTGAVATAYAAAPFDAVVLASSAADAFEDARAIVPGAAVLVDPGEQAVPASAPDLYDPPTPAPWELRTGVVVVGDFVAAGEAGVARIEREISAALRRHLGTLPVCVVGFDPGGRIAASLPGAVATGPLDDPLPWLRAGRAVLVATDAGASHWLAAAALAGTPAFSVPEDVGGEDLDACCHALAALADPRADVRRALRRTPVASGALHRPDAHQGTVPFTTLAPAPFRASPPRSLGTPLVEVRAGVPPDLSPRRTTRCVVELSWGYGSVPVEWTGALRDVADEVWVPGPWGARVLEAAGLEKARIQTVAPGIDTVRYAPERRPYPLATKKGVRLLFVGDCDEASGIDALVEAYYIAFGPTHDVCLVVRPTGSPGARTFEPDIRRAAAGVPDRPEVELIDEHLTEDGLAALYRACDVLVRPQRATGSAETVLAAMASGRAVITLSTGAAADLCDEQTGWVVPCHVSTAIAPPWLEVTRALRQLEPRRAALADALRATVASPDDRLRKGLAARERAVRTFSLAVTGTARAARLERLERLGARGEELSHEAPVPALYG